MKKAINYKNLSELMIFFILFSTLYSLFPIPSFAQTATPEGSLIEKLDALKKEIASKAAEIKTEINRKVQNKAVLGSILRIGDSQITIQTFNAVKTVQYDEFTEVIGLGSKKIKIKTLEESDNIAALGDIDDKNNLSAKRIIFLENYASSSAELAWGQIKKITGSALTIKNTSGKEETILTSGQTAFFLGNNEASVTDGKPEKFVAVRGSRLKDGSIKARFVYFIPSIGFMKVYTQAALTKSEEKSASVSANKAKPN